MENETYLPIFSGFYNTQWEFDYNYIEDFIKEERKEKNLFSKVNFNDLKIDYNNFEIDIVNLFCEVLPDFLPDFITSCKLQEVIRPKEYNFKNDSANVLIDVKIENIKAFIYANKEKFSEFLKSRYKSCDGFISWYSYDFETWENETKKFSDFTINGHYLGAVLDFIAIMLEIDNFTMYETIIEKINFLSYAENLDDIINQQDGSLFEFLTSRGIEKNFADYIETSFTNKMLESLSLSEKILSLIQEYKEEVI